jgi:basic membrane protein A and related proteins
MHKKLSLLLVTILIASLLLVACQPAEQQQGGQQGTTTAGKICQVTDAGGIDDKSFNATAWRGAQRAQTELNFEAKYLESQQQTDYERNINLFMEEDCDLIVTVGFLLGDATAAAAQVDPNQKFTIVDYAYDPAFSNVLGLVFDTDQAAFLAGYLAAGMTKTGKVGTFGGIQIPPVTIFMDGLYYGVQHYNQVHGTNVEVVGWDPVAQTGLFVGNFESTDDGRDRGQALLGEGVDIIMPVAGPVGLGTAEAVKSAGNAWIIGVDTDWTVSTPQYADVILTSVNKNMDVAVFTAAQQVANNAFQGGLYIGTLENGGVGLGTIAGAVPEALRNEVNELRQAIIAGSINVGP